MNNSPAVSAKKRGRKPLGERAMTTAERKVASRAKLEQAGYKEFTIKASGLTLQVVEAFAAETSQSRSQVIHWMLEYAVSQLVLVEAAQRQLVRDGASAEEIERTTRELLDVRLSKSVQESPLN